MGLGVPVEHPTRVDIQRAARVFAAVGRPWTYLEGCRPRGHDIDHAIAQLVPGRNSAISLGRGAIALEQLGPVALAIGGYTDVVTGNATVPNVANVRVWADKAWLHRWTAAGELDTAADLRSTDRAMVFETFRGICGPQLVQATIMHPDAVALAALPAYCHATGADVLVEADLPVGVVASLTERIGCERWQTADLFYEPETGRLWNYLIAPVSVDESTAWIAWVDAGLAGH